MVKDFDVDVGTDTDVIFHEVAIMKQLIRERKHPLALVRELISNAGAREVGASRIKITYYVHPELGNVFEVADDGCGMDFTNDPGNPGRLDRFLGLGLSGIAGLASDEFAWKGLGSKLSYQSRRVEIETWTGTGKVWSAVVNEPWETIERGQKPRPRITQWDPEQRRTKGSIVRVFGHPPRTQSRTFTLDEVRAYVQHRTFVGFTKSREDAPLIELAVLGRTEAVPFGFPELGASAEQLPDDTVRIGTLQRHKNLPGQSKGVTVVLKGFYTSDPLRNGLSDKRLNTGLIVSVKGIPYFVVGIKDYGSRQLFLNPGPAKCCLISECDEIREEMDISRSGLNDSALTDLFQEAVAELIAEVEAADEYRRFRGLAQKEKLSRSAQVLRELKAKLEAREQNWVYWRSPETGELKRLCREPANEQEALCVLWKLEALNALPFQLETLGHTSCAGPDLVVHLQEDASAEPQRYAAVEVEHRFWNYRSHGHISSLHPVVICWDLGSSLKVTLDRTDKDYKFRIRGKEREVTVYALRRMPGVLVSSRTIEDSREPAIQ